MDEIVLTSDPGLALLLDTNPEIAHLLVAAHVFGHVDYFTNNLCLADTYRRMVHNAVAHALHLNQSIERYGLEVVEHLMGIDFALDRLLSRCRRRQALPTRLPSAASCDRARRDAGLHDVRSP